ncbi:MAG TPA: BatA and WFA domain-containing protein, partial [Elusimicrobiota bacterium]|nr:BatA and WFA domain-containing protein [Elusimicrobiota bacterium]
MSLSFLNPAVLWALPLCAAPLVVHLLFLRRAGKVPFSDLELIRRARAGALSASRLRQWLLLAARVGAIAALVLAFAGPLARRRDAGASSAAPGADEEGVSLVALADVSWSMGAVHGGRSRWERCRAAFGRLAAGLGPRDRVAVGAFSDRVEAEPAWARDPGEAERALARLAPGWRGSDAAPALSAAYRLLASERRPGRRVILLLSDGQEALLRRLPAGGLAALPGYDPAATLLALRADKEPRNAAVESLRPSVDGAGRPTLAASLRSFGGGREAAAQLWLDQQKAAAAPARLSPEGAVSFALPKRPDGRYAGRVALEPDALAADDSMFYSLEARAPPRVLALHGEGWLAAGRGGYFLKHLLETGALPYGLETVEVSRLASLRLEDFGVVILAGSGRLPPGAASALDRFVSRGGGLWVIPGPPSTDEGLRELAPLLPARLDRVREGLLPSAGLTPGAAPERGAAGAFRWSDFELDRVSMQRAWSLDPAPGAAVWFRDGDGRALAAEGPRGAGRVLVWGGPLDLEWTNLGAKPAFAALVDAAVSRLGRYDGAIRWRALRAGDPLVRVWEAGEAAPARVLVRAPGGRSVQAPVRARRLEYRDTAQPGLYVLSGAAPGGADEAYAVNLDRSDGESDLAPAARPPWSELGLEAIGEDFARLVRG